jgi:hypothetical protein
MWLVAAVFLASSPPVVDAHEEAVVAPTEDQAHDIIKTLMLASPYRISDHALAGKIRYEFSAAGDPEVSFPETGEQHVERRGDRYVVTICKDRCGEEVAPTRAELQRALQPNRWVQSDDRVLREFARVSPNHGDVDSRMRKLVMAVEGRMSGPIEYRHYRSSREAYDRQSGDCTESALLLGDGSPESMAATNGMIRKLRIEGAVGLVPTDPRSEH